MKGRVVRSVSFPAEDLNDLQDLSEEHGGFSALFQYLYRALLDHRAETSTDPGRAELAALVHERKAAEEARAEALARMRRDKAEERAAAARARDEIVKTARAKRASAPKAEPRPSEPEYPETFEGNVDRFVTHELVFMTAQKCKIEEIERTARNIARNLDYDADKFWHAITAAGGVNGQTNLRVLPAPRKEANR